MDFVASLFSALTADSGLSALLDTFDGSLAIFSGDKTPDDFAAGDLPFIWIRPPHSAITRDTFDAFGRTVELDLCFYAKTRESAADLDAAVEAVRLILHRQILPAAVSGDADCFCTVSGPFGAPTSDPSIAGRRLSARLDLRG